MSTSRISSSSQGLVATSRQLKRCRPVVAPSARHRIARHTRHYASAALAHPPETPSPTPTPPGQMISSPPGIYETLDHARDLLESDFGGSSLWLERVQAAQDDLQVARPGRIGVYGDHRSGARDVVSAMLQDPLADSEGSRHALLSRHVDANTPVMTCSHGLSHARKVDSLDVRASWLGAIDYELREITLAGDALVSAMLGTDISVFVIDPYRLIPAELLDAIRLLATRGNAIIVVDGPVPSSTSESTIRQDVEKQMQSTSTPVFFTQSTTALSALNALPRAWNTSPSDTGSIESFQRGFVASRIGELQAHLGSLAAANPLPQLVSAQNVARLAYNHMTEVMASERVANRSADALIRELRSSSRRAAVDAKHLSVVSRGIEGGLVAGGVQHSLAETSRGISALFQDRWSWLDLMRKARADEVGGEMRVYLERHFGKDLERNIIFETGQLARVQQIISHETDDKLRQLAKVRTTSPSLSSPLLVNHLSTLALSIPAFEATSLLAPLTVRREQLLRESVPRLQSSAQRSLVSTLGVSASGLAVSWAAYVPPLALLSEATASGLGILSVVAALALGQRSWGQAQKRFWEDWGRITSMLRGDLQTILDETIETRLLAKPTAAADGLERLLQRREKRLDALERTIESAKQQL